MIHNRRPTIPLLTPTNGKVLQKPKITLTTRQLPATLKNYIDNKAPARTPN